MAHAKDDIVTQLDRETLAQAVEEEGFIGMASMVRDNDYTSVHATYTACCVLAVARSRVFGECIGELKGRLASVFEAAATDEDDTAAESAADACSCEDDNEENDACSCEDDNEENDNGDVVVSYNDIYALYHALDVAQKYIALLETTAYRDPDMDIFDTISEAIDIAEDIRDNGTRL